MAEKKKFAEVTLDESIVRGDTRIDQLKLRRPGAGELRGLSLAELTTLKTDAMYDLLPRITVPPITQAEAEALDPADLFQCSLEIAGFFMPVSMTLTLPKTTPAT